MRGHGDKSLAWRLLVRAHRAFGLLLHWKRPLATAGAAGFGFPCSSPAKSEQLSGKAGIAGNRDLMPLQYAWLAVAKNVMVEDGSEVSDL